MGTTRYVYNQALYHTKQQEKTNVDKKKLQSLYVTKKYRNGEINEHIQDWELETPKDIRNGAIRDLHKAFKTCFSQLKTGCIDKFNIGYKRKKTYPSVEIPKKALTVTDGLLFIFKTYGLGGIKLSRREKNFVIDYDCRLCFQYNHWFLVVPTKKQCKASSPSNPICGLDPGVRTFQTIYSNESVSKVQHNRDLLFKLRSKIDHFKSLRAQKLIPRSSFTRRMKRIYRRAKYYIQELHYQTIQLLRGFSHVLLPSFESQDMVQGRLHRKTKRELLGLQHFLFQTRLRDSFQLDKSCNVTIVTEEYTSKTCGYCGHLTNVGSSETYKCSKCHLTIDRDINGARNVLLKYLSG
jgi:putative transposase